MFVVLAGIIISLIKVTASYRELPTVSVACPIGNISENECVVCICSQERVYECRSKPCNVTGLQNKLRIPSCHPKMLYVHNYTVCLCNENGTWPHKTCRNIFKTLDVAQSCTPNTYVTNDCNVCRCESDGILDKKHCTKNVCPLNIITRRFIQNHVYGSCEAQNWYSLAPCQFCYCVSENKLVCNTGNNVAKKLQLGSYNLSVCGKDLMEDGLGLIPKKDKVLRLGLQFSTESPIQYVQNELKGLEEGREYNNNNQDTIKANQVDKKLNESDEYYSESEEDKLPKPIPTRKDKTTNSPYKDSNIKDNGNDQSPESETEIRDVPIEAQQQKVPVRFISETEPKYHDNYWNDHSPKVEQISTDSLSLGDVLKPYLPMVLDKVFQLALRKSMVSVDAHSKCIPGSTSKLKCNTCFCLKNNKLLCTDHDCK